jgi:hypothetical protein
VSHDTLESQMDSDPQDYFSAYVRTQGPIPRDSIDEAAGANALR